MIKRVVEVTYLTPASTSYNPGGVPWATAQAYFQPEEPNHDVRAEVTNNGTVLSVRNGNAYQYFPLERVVTWREFPVEIPFRATGTQDACGSLATTTLLT